jgi:hypothetical protein
LDKRGGSAFLPADLDQMLEVREDHAGYIGHPAKRRRL